MMAMSMMIMNMITIILSDKNYFDDSDDNSKIHQATVVDNLVDGRRVKQVVYIRFVVVVRSEEQEPQSGVNVSLSTIFWQAKPSFIK